MIDPQLRPKLLTWAVCPQCCRPHGNAVCPTCQPGSEVPRRLAGPAPGPALQPGGLPGNPELGGITLGALGIVPLLGLVFCALGVVLSIAALRSARARSRSAGLAYLGLAVSLTTAVPGILLWGWLRAAAAAW